SVCVVLFKPESALVVATRVEFIPVPSQAVAGAVLAIARSAIRWAVVVAIAELLVALASSAGLEAATVAVLAIGPVAVGLMCTTKMGRGAGREGGVLKVEFAVAEGVVHGEV